MRRKAFTLIELLVVIAIIAMLLSIVMPAIRSAKGIAQRVVCTSNLKQLQLGWLMYADANDERIPGANVGNAAFGWVESMMASDPWEVQIEAIEQGALFDYIGTTDCYRCPTSKKGEARSYSIVSSMNTNNKNTWKKKEGVYFKKSDIVAPGSRHVFICEGVITNHAWGVNYNTPQWKGQDPPPVRHNGGAFSFVDGHSDFNKWQDKRTFEWAEVVEQAAIASGNPDYMHTAPSPEQPDNEDLVYCQRGMWGTVGYARP